ncbi:thermonuclease family protein [Brevundimonas sp.]|uniref:thermonuclease family protein n=1 Tax=Brevundimonas sp. TaxID=1871086 RepID=UPI002ED7CA7D
MMAGRRDPRRTTGPWTRTRSRVGMLTEGLVLAVMVLAVTVILRPGADTAHAEAEPARAEAVADAGAERLEGVARVIDGDTLDVGGVRVRLHGIDAFERDQMCDRPQGPWACGAAATRALKSRAEGRRLACEVLDTDRYGRKVSRCEREGVDVAEALVAGGLALAYRRYSRDYVDEELAAEAGGAGAWNGSFDRPEQWRRAS